MSQKKIAYSKKDTPESGSYQAISSRVSITSMVVNLLLAGFKFAAGFLGHSSAMISDAVHSSSDIFGSLIVMIGVNLSEKEEDEGHPYGHERLECVASILVALLLLLAAVSVASSAVTVIREGKIHSITIPGKIALIAAVLSIVVKEMLYRYTMHFANELDSEALRAEAWHDRSDAFSSIGSLIGIAGARLGWPVLDPVAGLVISFFILKAAFDIFKEAVEKLTDHSCDPAFEQELRDCVSAFPEVRQIDLLRTREFGRKIYVDLEISMPGEETLLKTHQTAEEIHDCLEKNFPAIKHVMIHVNPL